MPWVPVRDGASLHVRVVGRGRPALMLAGLGMHGAHWLPFIGPHLGRHRFYLLDYRGVGPSRDAPPAKGDFFGGHAHDVRDVVEHFGLRDFALVGYSLGATTALHLLRDHGFEGVRRYLHIDQSPFTGYSEDWAFGLGGSRHPDLSEALLRLRDVIDAHPRASTITELPAEARRAAAAATADMVVAMGGPRGFDRLLLAGSSLPRALLARVDVTDLAFLRQIAHAYGSGPHDYRAALRGCATPITLFVGMRSALYDPRGQLAIADYASRVRTVPFHRSGHVLCLTEPRKFVRELGAFLDGDG